MLEIQHTNKYLFVRSNACPISTQELDLAELGLSPEADDENWENDDFERAPTLKYEK